MLHKTNQTDELWYIEVTRGNTSRFTRPNINISFHAIGEHLNISQYEAEFLFGYSTEMEDGILKYKIDFCRIAESKTRALTRLHKYIYYKLHKREMLGDLNTKEGRVKYERARRLEGNHNFAVNALQEA